MRRPLSPVGVVAALVFLAFSFTPTLIPRDTPYQIIASGMSLISGYGLGTAAGWLLRRVGFDVRWGSMSRRTLWVSGGVAVAAIVTVMSLGVKWQNDIRALMGIEPLGPEHVTVVFGALVLAAVLLGVARGVRGVGRWLGRLLTRIRVPRRAARLAGGVAVAVLVILLVDGVLYEGLLRVMNTAYATIDDRTDEGVARPTATERTGSPASPVAWETLGRQGRNFVAGGQDLEALAAFAAETGSTREAMVPIRVYAGLASTDHRTLEEAADLVVSELDRTEAWDRSVLVVVTTTGTGWVDPAMSESIELMWAGDTAIAAMQYSFLPSWVSFVGDRTTPPAAGKALFEAVYEAWSERPEDDRPLLFAFGVSLGSYGMQGAFGSIQDVAARTDGALFVGTPYFTDLWGDLTENRDPGSFQWNPIYLAGDTVRWGTDVNAAANVWDLGETWDRPRVVYLQHASDGVVWWTSDLILRRPDWIAEPKGPDVLPYIWWMPFVTFWQVSMDQFVAGAVPAGHGHNYVLGYADSWAAIAPPDGWDHEHTSALRARLQAIIDGLP